MPVTTTVGALAVAAALAAGPALTTTPALVADQTDNRTCTVQTTTGNTSTSTGTGGTGTGGTGTGGTGQLTPDQAAKLLEQTRELVTSLTLAGADARAAALSSGIRALGITPAVASGWQQQAHDLADTTLAAMGDDPAAGALAVALAKAGYSPTPADLRTDTNKAPGTSKASDTSASTATGTASGQDAAAGGGSGPAIAPSAAAGSVLLAGGALVAAIRALPADGVEACGLDSTTSRGSSAGGAAGTGDWSAQADALLAQLTGDSDPAARQLAQIIEQARASGTGTGNTVNNQVTERGNNGSTTGNDSTGTSDSGATSTGTTSTDNGRSDTGSTDTGSTDTGSSGTGSTGQGSTGSTTGGDTAPGGGGATGSGATTGADDAPTDQTSTGGAGAAGQAWEAKAQKLADELSSAGDDPVARNLSKQLAAQGITGRAQQAGTTNPTDTTSTGTNSTGTNSGDSSSTSDSADQGGGDSDQASDQDSAQDAGSGQHGTDDEQSSNDQDQQPQDDETSQDQQEQEPQDQGTSDDAATAGGQGGDTQSGSDASASTTWDRLAQCESGGDWKINTGNGYGGGLQFAASTWKAYGGDAYAPSADRATREQQIAVAEKVKADRGGYSAWPACSRKLGLQ